jgi:hypothetical protein
MKQRVELPRCSRGGIGYRAAGDRAEATPQYGWMHRGP